MCSSVALAMCESILCMGCSKHQTVHSRPHRPKLEGIFCIQALRTALRQIRGPHGLAQPLAFM